MKSVTFLGKDYVVEDGVGLPTGAVYLNTLSGPQLVTLYNLLVSNMDAGNGVSKFTNRDIGIKRTAKQLIAYDSFDFDDGGDDEIIAPAPQPDVLKSTAKAEGKKRAYKARTNTKKEKLIAILKTDAGASLDEIADVVGWQRHTTRAFISRDLRKNLGLNVTKSKIDGRGTVYRIAV